MTSKEDAMRVMEMAKVIARMDCPLVDAEYLYVGMAFALAAKLSADYVALLDERDHFKKLLAKKTDAHDKDGKALLRFLARAAGAGEAIALSPRRMERTDAAVGAGDERGG